VTITVNTDIGNCTGDLS